ncbi:hypothetical protein E4U42_003262 [Claviceps africana]|uniref:Thioesterase domain-containing protein n=1 Tax=Claviceps africana TaxID=83212 RepID=A0A8K0NIZ9_9HYPO|nr:hypothetical protein E4U42_003262 [Claviceps africana]
MFSSQIGRATRRLAHQSWRPTARRRQTSPGALSPAQGSLCGFRSRRGQHSQSGGAVDVKGGHAADQSSDRSSGGGRGRGFRNGFLLVLFGLTCGSAGAYASWKALQSRGLGFYSDEESLRRFTPDEADADARRIQDTINAHPMVVALRQRPELTESRPHLKMPGQYRARSLTGSALAGPGKVPVPAYAWTEGGGKSLVSVVFVGEHLCGHPGLVHGGFLATMLDEGLARCCFGALPHNVGVTANLNIDYRKPTPAGTYLVLRAETTKVDGRKAWVKGRIESLPGPGETPVVYAEATALFVSPKFAAMLPKLA